jgi:preprotein translocase subunit SecD
MKQSNFIKLVFIILLVGVAIWVALPNNPGNNFLGVQRDLEFVLGLDLRGGVQALLGSSGQLPGRNHPQMLENAKSILENRTNALGVSENQFQVAGDRRMVAEFPGLTDPAEVLSVIKETGQLEFVDLGDTFPTRKVRITTDLGSATQPILPFPSIRLTRPPKSGTRYDRRPA